MSTSAAAPHAAWRELYPFQSRYASTGEHRLHYIDEGHGSAVVMLHGNPTWSFHFRNLVRQLRGDWRAIALDHMGCGLSDKPQRYPYRLAQHIDNLEMFLRDHLQLDKVTLVLHDWGGAIGAGYAVRHPERVQGLVIMNSAAFLLPHCPWRIRICRIPGFGVFAVQVCNGFARAALRFASAHPEKLRGAVAAGYLAPYDTPAHRIAHLRFVQDIPLRADHPSRATLTAIQDGLPRLREKPTLICWGEHDFCFTEAFLQTWLQFLPSATVERYPDAGHFVLEDACEPVCSRITGFLSEHIATVSHEQTTPPDAESPAARRECTSAPNV